MTMLAEQQDAIGRVEWFRETALTPAHVPPPSLDSTIGEIEDGSVHAVARLVRPESSTWNQWAAGGPRLFNNRAALLFEVTIDGPGPIDWVPEAATLEVNDPSRVLAAAPSAEVLLADLLYHALLEERWAIDGDLVDRTRGAGPFRAAYLPPSTPGTELSGVVAFPLVGPEGPLPELHVVALRLAIPVRAGDGVHDLVWVFR